MVVVAEMTQDGRPTIKDEPTTNLPDSMSSEKETHVGRMDHHISSMREIRSAEEYFRRLCLEVLIIINSHAISDGAMILNIFLRPKESVKM
jgi:hypothetical protein